MSNSGRTTGKLSSVMAWKIEHAFKECVKLAKEISRQATESGR